MVNEWSKKLGKTFGLAQILKFNIIIELILFLNKIRYYEGHTPVLVTSDLDLIREVFIKQFHCFSARKVFI